MWAETLNTHIIINITDPVPLAAMHDHVITLPPPSLTQDVCFGLWAVPFLLQTFLFHHSDASLDSDSRTWSHSTSNLSFLFSDGTSGVHLVVNSLCLRWWRYLLVVDFDNGMYSSLFWKGFSLPRFHNSPLFFAVHSIFLFELVQNS